MACEKCNQNNKDRDIVWDGESGEYHIEVGDSYYDVYGIKYCPYCGEDLSKRVEDSKKCVLTAQQQVQYDMIMLGPAKMLENITKKIGKWKGAEYEEV